MGEREEREEHERILNTSIGDKIKLICQAVTKSMITEAMDNCMQGHDNKRDIQNLKERVDTMEKSIEAKIDTLITNSEKEKEKKQGRSWEITIILVGFVLAIAQIYIATKIK